MPPAMPTSIWPRAILLATCDGGLDAGVAGLLDVVGRGLGREPGAEHRLAGQVEVAGVLEHRAGDDLAEPLALQAVAGDQAVDRGGQHVLVGRGRVDGVRARERDPVAADDGDATGLWPAWTAPQVGLVTQVTAGYILARPPGSKRTEAHVTLTMRPESPPRSDTPMSDRYQSLIHTPVGQLLAKNLGLPNPVAARALDRGRPAGRPAPSRSAATAGSARRWSPRSTSSASPPCEDADRPTRSTRAWSSTPPASPPRTSSSSSRSSSPRCCAASRRCPRVVVLGTPPESTNSARGARRAARPRGLHPLARQGGRPRRHRPARVRRPGRRRRARLDAGVPALPQVGLRLGPGRPDRRARRDRRRRGGRRTGPRPLAGKVALVTGASRGIGEQIARVLHRDGATVLGIDVPQAASELQAVMAELGGDHLTLDITTKDAPQRIAQHVKDDVRRRRHRRAQRRHHPRQAADEHEAATPSPPRSRSTSPRRSGSPPSCSSRSWSTPTAGSSASPRSPASPATSARPTTPPPRPA